jgi:hypothetical protein
MEPFYGGIRHSLGDDDIAGAQFIYPKADGGGGGIPSVPHLLWGVDATLNGLILPPGTLLAVRNEEGDAKTTQVDDEFKWGFRVPTAWSPIRVQLVSGSLFSRELDVHLSGGVTGSVILNFKDKVEPDEPTTPPVEPGTPKIYIMTGTFEGRIEEV